MSYETISLRHDGPVSFLTLERGPQGNPINDRLVAEATDAVAQCEEAATVLVVEGAADVFCLGADFRGLTADRRSGQAAGVDAEPLYDLWRTLATGPCITVCHVRGRANAGGLGFVAACDVVLADHTAQFCLSEMLFGLFPACVLPFLVRKIGFQRSHYLALTTQPVSAEKAHAWGLVDACERDSAALLRRHLQRLRPLSKAAVTRYKEHLAALAGELDAHRRPALAANREMFADPRNLERIARYVEQGKLPWEE